VRVMRVLTRPNLGGPTHQAIALWHAHRELGIATLLVTGRVERGETASSPAAGGVPELPLADAFTRGEHAAGWVELSDLRRGVAPLADRRAARTLDALLRSFRPDVVHTHTSKAGWLGRRAAFAAGVPTVHTFHGHVLHDYFARPVGRVLARLERALAVRTGRLVAVSASCADELAAAGVAPRERFALVPPAVALVPPSSRADARAALALPADGPRLVCVGRLVPIKRVEDFVATVAASGVPGDVLGDGPRRARLERLAAAQGAPVVFRGAVADAARLLPAWDVLVLPSVREGLPLVAVEAARAALPVVGYDVPGVRDAIDLGVTGTLVPPAAGPAGLAAAVRGVLAAPRARPVAAATGDAFAPQEVAERLAAVYRGLLGGRDALP
jgi:glycosyltransferase involved in cell wall biosynthesis